MVGVDIVVVGCGVGVEKCVFGELEFDKVGWVGLLGVVFEKSVVVESGY